MQNGDVVLDKVLKNANKVILHRQKIAQKTKLEIRDSYGGKTYGFSFGYEEFQNILSKNNFAITHYFKWNNDSYSFLLVRQ